MGIPRAAAARPSKAGVARNGQRKCPCRVGILHCTSSISILYIERCGGEFTFRTRITNSRGLPDVIGLVHVGQHQDACDGASKLRLSRTPHVCKLSLTSIAPLLFSLSHCVLIKVADHDVMIETDTKRSKHQGGQPAATGPCFTIIRARVVLSLQLVIRPARNQKAPPPEITENAQNHFSRDTKTRFR